jgi:transposase InsO family protein
VASCIWRRSSIGPRGGYWRTGCRSRWTPSFCVEALQEAIARYGTPQIFNTDQGSQFTSEAFSGTLLEHGIRISMDGKGAWRDNVFVERLWRSVKYEEVVCYERDRCSLGGSDASPKMRVGPSKSACKSRLQTASSCVG